MSVFNWVKPTQAFSHSLTYPHFIHNPTNHPLNYPQATNNLVDNYNNTITPYNLVISCTTTHNNTNDLKAIKQHTQQHNTHKQYNNTTTHKRTYYSHHNSPTTLTTYKTINQLSKCCLHLKYIIIKQYNITALNQTIQLLQAIKKSTIYNRI